MALKARLVVVGVAATRLDTQPDKDNLTGQSVVIQPTTDIFVGGDDVTVAQGFLVPGGSSLSLDLVRASPVYGIAAANVNTRVLQVNI